jgi:hypothetical protein
MIFPCLLRWYMENFQVPLRLHIYKLDSKRILVHVSGRSQGMNFPPFDQLHTIRLAANKAEKHASSAIRSSELM